MNNTSVRFIKNVSQVTFFMESNKINAENGQLLIYLQDDCY